MEIARAREDYEWETRRDMYEWIAGIPGAANFFPASTCGPTASQ
jgi:hypothetical protein